MHPASASTSARDGRSRPAVVADGIVHGGGEQGYNMVLLMVLVTVLNVLVAAALPAWSTLIQREKEEELIFRGLQYAEAIRVFQARFGRLPNRLEELIEVEPRSIRRLWEDPMTGEARWGLIFEGAGAPIPGQPGQVVGGGPAGSGAGSPRPISNDPEQRTQGPINGVYSLADGESLIEFQGKQSYSEWHFTPALLPQGAPPVPVNPGAPKVPDLSVRWVGRPWPREIAQLVQQQNLRPGGMPGQPGLAPGGPGQSPTGLPTQVPDSGGPGSR